MTVIENFKLDFLHLYDNLLTVSLTDEFYNMPLVDFDCTDNLFYGNLSEDIEKMYDLVIFKINGNHFMGTTTNKI